MSFAAPRLSPPRDRTALRVAAVLVALDLAIAVAVVEPRLQRALLLVAGVVALALVFRFPFAATCCVLILTDSIFYAGFFSGHAGPIGLKGEEIMFALVFALALFRPRRAWWGGTAGGLLALFLALVLVSDAAAISVGRVGLTSAFNWTRPFAFLGLFYVVVRLYPERAQLQRILLAAAILAAVTGFVGLAITAHPSLGSHLQGPGAQEVRPFGGLTRIHLAGLGFAYMLLWWAALESLSARGSRRFWLSAIVVGMVLNLALSFNRNMWVGTFLGLMLLLVVGGTAWRRRLLVALCLAGAGLVLLVAALGSVAPSSAVDPLVQRGSTLLNPQSVGEEDSLLSRANETHFAWIAAKQHPLLGVGAGAGFGVAYNQSQGNGFFKRVQQNFLHNQYLYLVLIGGVPGFLLFVAFLLTVLRRAWSGPRLTHPLTVLGVGIVMLMVSAAVMPYFSVPDMTAAIGVIAGVIIAWSSPREASLG